MSPCVPPRGAGWSWPPPSARPWRCSTAPWSTSRCARWGRISARRWPTCSGWSTPTCSPWPPSSSSAARSGTGWDAGASSSSGVAWFAVASLACGLAQTTGQLIVARGVQGVGGALPDAGEPGDDPGEHRRPDDRPRAIGIWSAWSGVAAAIGPLLGGWIVDAITWRWVFLINVPVAAAGHRPGAAARAGVRRAAASGPATVRRRGRRPRRGGPRRCDVRAHRRRLGAGGRRRRRAGRLPRRRARQPQPDAAAAALRRPHVLRRQPHDVRGVRRAGGADVLPGAPAPGGRRLLAAPGRARDAAVDRAHAGLLAPGGRAHGPHRPAAAPDGRPGGGVRRGRDAHRGVRRGVLRRRRAARGRGVRRRDHPHGHAADRHGPRRRARRAGGHRQRREQRGGARGQPARRRGAAGRSWACPAPTTRTRRSSTPGTGRRCGGAPGCCSPGRSWRGRCCRRAGPRAAGRRRRLPGRRRGPASTDRRIAA